MFSNFHCDELPDIIPSVCRLTSEMCISAQLWGSVKSNEPHSLSQTVKPNTHGKVHKRGR